MGFFNMQSSEGESDFRKIFELAGAESTTECLDQQHLYSDGDDDVSENVEN